MTTPYDEVKARLTALERNQDGVFARMSMLEFCQEIIVANFLANTTEDISKKWKDDFLRLSRTPNLSEKFSPASEQKEAQLVEIGVQMSERFVKKVTIREALIRLQLKIYLECQRPDEDSGLILCCTALDDVAHMNCEAKRGIRATSTARSV
jgi:hypothetical protein